MKTRKFFPRLLGDWEGSYSLWLDPSKPPQDSVSTASIGPVADGRFLLFTYAWAKGGEAQEGVMLLAGKGTKASATWGDSFHMEPLPMICVGSLVDEGRRMVLLGHYPAGEEEWGWRTELICETPDAFTMKAFNITPQGEESIAVTAEFTRVAGGGEEDSAEME